MEDKTVYKVRDKSGRFIKKEVKPVKIYAVVSPSDHEKLTAFIPEGGTISDVFREAIALYLKSKEG
jgi:hypothetical protein